LGVPATNNFVACVTLINKDLKKRYPKPRKEWATEEFIAAEADLEDILNILTRRYKGLLSGKIKG
jgi:DNA repair protein RadD